MKSADFDSVNPVYSLEDDKVVFKDGRVAVGFRVEAVEEETWSQQDYEQQARLFTQALHNLPIGALIQKTDCYYRKRHCPETQQGYFFQKTARYFQGRPLLLQQSYLFISFPTHRSVKPNAFSSFFTARKVLLSNPFAGIRQRLEQAEAQAGEFVQALGYKDLHFTRLGNRELETLYRQYFQLEFALEPERMHREYHNDLSALIIGEKKVNMVSLKSQAVESHASVKNSFGISASMVAPLTRTLDTEHVLTQSLLIEDTEKELQRLDMDKKINRSLDFLSTQDNRIKSEEIDAFTGEVRLENKRLVSFHLSVLLFGEHRKRALEQTLAAFRSIQGAHALVESYDTANLFFACLPGNGFQNYRWLLTTADRAVRYVHFTTSYRSDKEGDLFCDRHCAPVLVNLFNTSLNNQNALVVGPSGSGKSYTIGHLIVQRFERGARQLIIDIGGSYKNTLTALNGKDFPHTYFTYETESPLAFNPFLVPKVKGRWQLPPEKVGFLVGLLSVIWKGPEVGHPLTPAERAILTRLIPEYYGYLNKTGEQAFPGMRSFYAWLQTQDRQQRAESEEYRQEMAFFNLPQLLVVLKPFATGSYKEVLNAQRELDISDYPLTCFDMEKIKGDATLYPIVSLLVTGLALDQLRKFPDQVKYIYMDEAWAMLSDALGDWVESMYRTIRKNKGSMCIITQGLEEIENSAIGAAILNNAQTQLILFHTDSSRLEKLGKVLGFTRHQQEQVRSLRAQGRFRELLIRQGESAKVFVLEAAPELDAVLSSKPHERNYLQKLIQRYGRVDYAVHQYLEDKEEPKKTIAQ
ncbi:DUF87 domain-containing protein [Rapidithrix thailandica]|uniref:DUF87 domain-containing protein n=1 Tax=Rapidithrix thailandica TaxID=413964 RepID=A0AAW9S6H4_9BACT